MPQTKLQRDRDSGPHDRQPHCNTSRYPSQLSGQEVSHFRKSSPTVAGSEGLPIPTSAQALQSPPSAVRISGIRRQSPPATSLVPSVPPVPSAISTIPELTDRYVPQTSIAQGVEFCNPRKFCLKPAYWRRWTGSTYLDFAETLRLQFDPVPFARKHNIPVEEVQAVFSTLVCNPLYDVQEAKRRGEEGMEAIMALHNQYGTPKRLWGGQTNDGKKVAGELEGIQKGLVRVIRGNGEKHALTLGELSEVDAKYLKDTLTAAGSRLLFGEETAGQ